MARQSVVSIDDKVLGPEPQWADQDTLSPIEFRSKFAGALNWYNYFHDKGKSKKYVSEYVKQTDPKNKELLEAIKKVPDWAVGITLTSICRMRMNGLTRTLDSTDAFIQKQFAEILTRASSIVEEKEEKAETPKVVVSLQQRMTETASKNCEEIEDAIEQFVADGFKGEFDAYKHCQSKGVKGLIAKRMSEFYVREADELEEALLGKCEQLVEGYSHMKKAELKRYAAFMRKIVDDIQRFAGNQKTVRKTRTKKPKPVAKQVAKVKYLKQFDELKLVSISPDKVVGAMVVWVYNVKYRRLGKYVASTREGFSFKGTTLQGYNEAESISKTLRKPEEALDKCLKGGKIILRKLLDDIKTQEKPLNGRFNEETIILRVADL